MAVKLGKTQTFSREINTELVLNLLRNKPCSGTEIAHELLLSHATASSIIKQLLEINVIKIDETKSNNPGEGELLIKSKVIHIQEIIDRVLKDTNLEDGFMRTGDIATKDDTNRYYIKGRIKDVIINANGENIYPDEIESYFAKVEHVNKIVVLGVKKGNASDATITCVIELKSDSDEQDIEEVKKQCYEINSSLANEKKVQVFLLSKNKLPLTTTMKVQRFKVKQQIINTPSNFVGFDEKKAVKSFDGYNMEDVEPIIKQLRNF